MEIENYLTWWQSGIILDFQYLASPVDVPEEHEKSIVELFLSPLAQRGREHAAKKRSPKARKDLASQEGEKVSPG